MKWLGILVGILLGVVVLLFGGVYAASELGGEVVVLHRKAADGSVDHVRVWIVEDDTGTWIEHGAPNHHWITTLASEPTITLERHSEARQYQAFAEPQSHAHYHKLRKEAYGVADDIVAVLGGGEAECVGVPVRIAPQSL